MATTTGDARGGVLPANWEPPVHATLVYIQKGNEVILIEKKRGHGAGKVNAPGGKLEGEESPLHCAIREVDEEIGLQVTNLRLSAVLRFQDFLNGFALQGHVYVSTVFDGTIRETEEAKPFWCDKDQLPYARMWEDDQFWLPIVLSGRSLLGDFLFENDRLTSWSMEVFPSPELRADTQLFNCSPE